MSTIIDKLNTAVTVVMLNLDLLAKKTDDPELTPLIDAAIEAAHTVLILARKIGDRLTLQQTDDDEAAAP